jgi:integrase/recombinase XerC
MVSTAFRVDDEIERQITAWQRDLGAIRRLAPRTQEAYGRDLAQFLSFLADHTGGQVSLTVLRELRGADLRAFMAARRADDLTSRSLARALSAIKSFFRFLEREGIMSTEALNVVRAPRQPRPLPKALTVTEAKAALATIGEMEERPWVAARDIAVLSLCYGAGSAYPRHWRSPARISTERRCGLRERATRPAWCRSSHQCEARSMPTSPCARST